MTSPLHIGAYYYPGWHSCAVRDAPFTKGWSEWDLVYDARPRFNGHEQPNLPAWGRLDESLPLVFEQKIDAALSHDIQLFVFAFYWSRGKRLLERALNGGFLGTKRNREMKFALMWANRMPRHVLPVKDPLALLIDPTRLVHTDVDDFLAFIAYIAPKYFAQPNYFRFKGGAYLSIFDTNFFLRQLGLNLAQKAIALARTFLAREGFGELHLAAIDPTPEFAPLLKELGFDSVTHYVFLPEWKGDLMQDFADAAAQKISAWPSYAAATGLTYVPSVSPGWDASPRAIDYGEEKPRRYPWSPIITGRDPDKFSCLTRAAIEFAAATNPADPLCLISSFNEWSEGHYLEPDLRYGPKWLEAVKAAARR